MADMFPTWCGFTGLYTDESPGLKVDPVVVMVLSIGFIISVVALHGEWVLICDGWSTQVTSILLCLF